MFYKWFTFVASWYYQYAESFLGNAQEILWVLVRNYNSVVHKNDTMYILWDISQHLPMDTVNELISKLTGKRYWLKGIMTKNMIQSYLKKFVILRQYHWTESIFRWCIIRCCHDRKRTVWVFNCMDIYMHVSNIICRIKWIELEGMMWASMRMIIIRYQ